MNHISDLKDIGKGKKCLIVGGGESLNKFEWDKLENIKYLPDIELNSQTAGFLRNLANILDKYL